MDRFNLEGHVYYQQGRKCGRPDCKCQRGELHGPYWYTRDDTGHVCYIGRELPSAIAAARSAHDRLLPVMERERRRLTTLLDAVHRLLRYDPLSAADRSALESLGLGAALVPQPDNQVTQDATVNGALVPTSTWLNTQARLCTATVGDTQGR